MPTIHYTKKEFIKQLENLIEDDEHIIISSDVDGTLNLNKKKGFKRIPFAFASDGFAKPDTLHDLYDTKLFAIVIAPNHVVAPKFQTKPIVES